MTPEKEDPTRGVRIGARGDFRIAAGLYKGHYPTRVEDMREDLLILGHPMFRGALLPVYRDMEFELLVEEEQAPLLIKMVAVRSDLRGAVPLLWGRLTAKPEKVQRRRFLRVGCFFEFSLFPLDVESRSPLEGRWLTGQAVDISLGGLRFRLEHPLALRAQDRFLLRLPLGQEEYPVSARLMRVGRFGEAWDLGSEFESLPRCAEKTLIDFIRAQERNVRSN